MKPIPKEGSAGEAAVQIPSVPLIQPPPSYSTANRRVGACPVQRVYPWLLFASTAVAATFCLAYITKPVILADSSPSKSFTGKKEVATAGNKPFAIASEKLSPNPNLLPGDTEQPIVQNNSGAPPAASLKSDFEETNIRVQHVLDAESINGDVSRVIVDVPVLYRSRNLRWTQEEATEARKLLELLSAHQEKTRALRDEGAALLGSWNKLMGTSIPSAALRADSPSLPDNQFDPLAPAGAGAAETIEAIKLSEPAE